MAGIASNQLRSAFVAETTANTIPTSPAFKTLHSPALFTGEVERFHQNSLVAGGARIGDTLITKPAVGKITGPLVYSIYDPLMETLFQSAWSADALTDGKARTTNSFENSIAAGIGGTRTYMRYTGVEAVGGQFMVAARGRGLHTCPQAAFTIYHSVIARVLQLPANEQLVCGMALGYADTSKIENSLITERESVEGFTQFLE